MAVCGVVRVAAFVPVFPGGTNRRYIIGPITAVCQVAISNQDSFFLPLSCLNERRGPLN